MTVSGEPPDRQRERVEGRNMASTSNIENHSTARRFFTPLLHVTWLSYLLATPLLAWMISIDIDFGGRWMCDPRPVGSLLVVHDRNGDPICQFEIDSMLLLWTVFAAIVSAAPIFGVYLRRHLARHRQLDTVGDSAAQERLWRAFYVSTGICVAFAAAVGRGWPLSFIFLPGAALVVYAFRFWRTTRPNGTTR